ncbi:MAG: hypothetical protein AAGA58_09835 [Verrucomicrobiota bacterium]
MNPGATLAVLIGAGLGLAGLLSTTKRVNEVRSDFEVREQEWEKERAGLQAQIDEMAFGGSEVAGVESGAAPVDVDREAKLLDQIGFLEEQLQLTREENKRLFDRIDSLELKLSRAGSDPSEAAPLEGSGEVSPGDREIRGKVEELVARIRKLHWKKAVPHATADWPTVREKVEVGLYPSWSDEEWEKKARAFAALGFMKPEMDFKKEAANILTAQLGASAYVDGEFFFNADASWRGIYDRASACLELTQVLQDQHFNVSAMLEEAKSLDEVVALQSLSIGDAAQVKVRYMLQDNFPTDDDMRQSLTNLSRQRFDQSPAFVREMFIFPYSAGMRFTQKVYQKDAWKSLDAAFANPPRTTSEILHPELYVDGGFEPEEIALDASLMRGLEALDVGTAGELAIAVLFHQTEFAERMEELKIEDPGEMPVLQDKDFTGTESSEAAKGWRGDSYAVYPGDDGDHVIWKTRWESAGDAGEFVTLMERTLARRHGVEFDGDASLRRVESGFRRITIHINADHGVTVLDAGDADWHEALAERAGLLLPES